MLNFIHINFCQVSATEASDPLPGTKEEGDLPRQVGFTFTSIFVCHHHFCIWQVNNQVLVEMARDIRPPPLEPSEVSDL